MKRREFITLIGGGLLAGDALLATVALAQSIGRWDHRHPNALHPYRGGGGRGKIYVVGGFGGERELEIYDSAAERWSRGASIPRALHHAAAVGLKDKLYVIGGCLSRSAWLITFAKCEPERAYCRGLRCASSRS
jgi:Kelch motif